MKKSNILFTLALLAVSAAAQAQVVITEFNSSTGGGGNFEFVEFTNIGNAPQSMVGWSEDDSGQTPNKPGHSLSAFGTLQPGQSAIFTEAIPDDFRTFWWGSVAAAPSPSVLPIIGPYSNDNLSGTSDAVTLFNGAAALVDAIVYPGTPAAGTASGVSRNPGTPSAVGLLGPSKNSLWVDSFIGDSFGSFRAAGLNSLIGNPGFYPTAVVPEPATWTLGLIGAALASLARWRRRR
jgi:hypothetical protein